MHIFETVPSSLKHKNLSQSKRSLYKEIQVSFGGVSENQHRSQCLG